MGKSSSDVAKRMPSKEAKELMTGGLLGKIYAGYEFLNDDLGGLSESGRTNHIKDEVFKSLSEEGLAEKDYQLMIVQTLGDGYPEGSLPRGVALYVVVTVPKFPKKPIPDNPATETADEAGSR
jgi:hypothetical protein